MSGIGHNSNVAGERLKSIVSRIETLENERKVLAEDIKDIFVEAKSAGFEVKALRALLAERRKDNDETDRVEALVAEYRRALGDFGSSPLGEAAISRAAA